MIIQDKTIILKSGAKCVLRNACAKDAEQMIHYLKVSAAETEFILRYPDEVTYTIEEEEKILEDNKSSPYNFMAVAEVDGVIAGNCAINVCGGKRKIRHRCSFGIALMKEYWGLGIGAALIELALEYAKKIGYYQVELDVSAKNERAIKLYEKYGFKKCGTRPNALKLDSGGFADEYFMVKVLGE